MARPKAGTKEGDAASERWRQTMINKYGVDGVHKKMQEIGSKGGANGKGPGYKGGFASNEVCEDGLTGKQRARIAGAKGGAISRRGPAKDDIEKAEEILKQESEKDGGN